MLLEKNYQYYLALNSFITEFNLGIITKIFFSSVFIIIINTFQVIFMLFVIISFLYLLCIAKKSFFRFSIFLNCETSIFYNITTHFIIQKLKINKIKIIKLFIKLTSQIILIFMYMIMFLELYKF